MSLTFYVLAGLVLVALLYFGLGRSLRNYLRYRGKRVVTCPENHETAAVDVDAFFVALSSGSSSPALRLSTCSRWPEREGCGQQCLEQIEHSPANCLVRNILTNWYAGKTCVYCEKPLGEIDWTQHRPALRAPDGRTYEWRDLKPETVPAALQTHAPVCWPCHIAQEFRRLHPELVVERDFKEREVTKAARS